MIKLGIGNNVSIFAVTVVYISLQIVLADLKVWYDSTNHLGHDRQNVKQMQLYSVL